MATRRRDIAPRKDKAGPSPSHTPNTHLKATSNVPSKTNSPPQNHNPTAPRKDIATSLKPTLRTSANNVFKQQVIKKPTSIDTPHKPSQKTQVSTNPSLRPRDKTPSPSQKGHVATNPSIRSRDKTPLPEQKRRVSIKPSIRDKTPSTARKTQVSTNPSQKRHTSTNPSIRDKTPLPSQKRHVSANPSIRDKTPLPARKTQVSTNPFIRSRDKTPLPARKTHVTTSTTPSLQSSSISGKTFASQKAVPGKKLKAINKDVGKRGSLHAMPVSTTLKTSNNIFNNEQENEKNTTSPTKEQITNTFQEKFKSPNIYQNVPVVETLPEDQESCTIVEAEEQIVEVVGKDEKGTIDLVLDDQEKLLAQVEAENDDDDDDDAKIVTNGPSPMLEQQEAPLDIKTQESEEKSYIEEKLEENSVHEIDSTNNINKSVADDYPKEEDEEKEVEQVEVIEKEEEKENLLDKKDEVASESEAIKSMETKKQEVVEEKKQESENVAKKQGGPRGKKDSVVSNDVIEETASKLREQRKNRVRALAGAFETVISLQ